MKKDITKRIDEILPFIIAGAAGASGIEARKINTGEIIKKPMKGARLIVVGKRWWHWLYKGSTIIIWNDKGKKKVFKDLPALTGMSWNELERAAHKKYLSITPRFIEKIIKRELL
jgi:hypothetical protein